VKILEDGTVVFETPVEEGDFHVEGVLPWEVQACHFYAECGMLSRTARHFHATVYEIKKLMAKAWWKEEFDRYRAEMRVKDEVLSSKVFEVSMEVVLDRLTKGNIIRVEENEDGTQTVRRLPVRAAEAAAIADRAFMRRQLMRNEPTSLPGAAENLDLIARQLRAIGRGDLSLLDAPTEGRGLNDGQGRGLDDPQGQVDEPNNG
jgi:hypothetical protein